MYWLELQDIMFLEKSIKLPTDNFNVMNYIKFAAQNNSSRGTRSATSNKLIYNLSHYNTARLNRIVRLWNALPTMNLSLSIESTRRLLKDISPTISQATLIIPFLSYCI